MPTLLMCCSDVLSHTSLLAKLENGFNCINMCLNLASKLASIYGCCSKHYHANDFKDKKC